MTNYSYYPTPEAPAPAPAPPKLIGQLPSKTVSDAQFWFSVFECTDTTKIDCDKLAILCGYKNAHTARTMISYKRKQMRPEQPVAAVNKVVKSRERAPVVKTESTDAVLGGKGGRKRKDAPEEDGALLKRRGVKKEEIE